MTDDIDAIKRALEAEYDLDSGFIGLLRQGEFDSQGLERLLALLQSIALGDSPTIDRRLVTLVWMIPIIMRWQQDAMVENGRDVMELRHGLTRVENAVSNYSGGVAE